VKLSVVFASKLDHLRRRRVQDQVALDTERLSGRLARRWIGLRTVGLQAPFYRRMDALIKEMFTTPATRRRQAGQGGRIARLHHGW
jgi:hypothetical protein